MQDWLKELLGIFSPGFWALLVGYAITLWGILYYVQHCN
jgi:hypothetical protein